MQIWQWSYSIWQIWQVYINLMLGIKLLEVVTSLYHMGLMLGDCDNFYLLLFASYIIISYASSLCQEFFIVLLKCWKPDQTNKFKLILVSVNV